MPRVSNTPISDEQRSKIDEALPTLLSSLKNKNEISNFTEFILMPEEKGMIGKRIMIYIYLDKNYPDTRIRSLLGVSFETVRFHKNNFNKFDLQIKKLIHHLSNTF